MSIQKKNNVFFQKKVSGLSLLEVLGTLVIMGVASLIIIKSLSPTVNKVKYKEAKIQLRFVHTLQQTYFMEFTKYSGDLDELGFSQRLLSTQDGDANYKIEMLDASTSGFKARATAVVDFNQNGTMDVWEMDQSGKVVNTVKD